MTITQKTINEMQPEIQEYAKNYGLDFFPTIFELVDYDTISQLAAYGGFPIRYPHWRFGMEYDQLSKGYKYGLQKIYEMVINTNPCYAYLMTSNSLVDQKLVMAHVYAHCDFFKNNYFFAHTNRKMIDEMANHAVRVRRYMDEFGLAPVEDFIEACLSLENLIDPHSPYISRESKNQRKKDRSKKIKISKLKSKKYMDTYINPPEFIQEQIDVFEKKKEEENSKLPSLAQPVQDVLGFLMQKAPLKNWQYDVLGIIRKEAYYFAPQAMTKIMNEGWATFWHSTIMTTKAVKPAEVLEYAEHHSGTVASHPGRINPYRIGYLLYKDIEDRWNKGKFGKAYNECENYKEKEKWDKQLGLGRKKIFEVRKLYNDITFIDAFLTEDFCRQNNLFAFAFNKGKQQYEIESRNFQIIKKRLLQSMTNRGQPIIMVKNPNYLNRGELLLSHSFEGPELDMKFAADTLKNMNVIWKRPVHIQTSLNNKESILSFDGANFNQN